MYKGPPPLPSPEVDGALARRQHLVKEGAEGAEPQEEPTIALEQVNPVAEPHMTPPTKVRQHIEV
nr:hypothetical protein [Klebsiella pneumoniae]